MQKYDAGSGAKGIGDLAMRNYQKWQEIRINMDTICEQKTLDTETELFGKKFAYPFFAGPVGAVKLHYGDKYTDQEYNEILLKGCAENRIAAFTGDGTDYNVMIEATDAIGKLNGQGIPTVKPWDLETIREKMELVKKVRRICCCNGYRCCGASVSAESESSCRQQVSGRAQRDCKMAEIPFILKGIMTPKGALKAAEAGVQGIVVSNHGGRVLDQCPATAEVLPSIVKAVRESGSQMKIFADGGIRTGVDVFKALALGADAVLIARPFVTAVYGGREEGVTAYVNKIGAELKDTMRMCGAFSLAEISSDMIWDPRR